MSSLPVTIDISPSPPSPKPPEGKEGDGDSSEYETDSSGDVDEFYITLDLTVPTPVQAGPSSNPYTNASFGRAAAPTASSHPQKSTHMLGASRYHAPRQLPKWARGATARRDRLQILDLSGDEVLVNYQNRIWAGSWTSTVGSELHIHTPLSAAAAEKEEVEASQTLRREPPRISGGGYYYSERDFSAAAAYVGGRRRKPASAPRPPPPEENEHWRRAMEDPECGKVVAVGLHRLHCSPAAVKAKEWPFAEQLLGKSDFLRRLERIQIEKGQLRKADAEHQAGRRRRRRKVLRRRRRGAELMDGEMQDGEAQRGDAEEEEEWVWESFSEENTDEEDEEEEEEEEEEREGYGYFAKDRGKGKGKETAR